MRSRLGQIRGYLPALNTGLGENTGVNTRAYEFITRSISRFLELHSASSVTANGVYLTTPLTMRSLCSQRFTDVWCGVNTRKRSPSAKAGGVFFANSTLGAVVNENPSRSKYDDIHIYFD